LVGPLTGVDLKNSVVVSEGKGNSSAECRQSKSDTPQKSMEGEGRDVMRRRVEDHLPSIPQRKSDSYKGKINYNMGEKKTKMWTANHDGNEGNRGSKHFDGSIKDGLKEESTPVGAEFRHIDSILGIKDGEGNLNLAEKRSRRMKFSVLTRPDKKEKGLLPEENLKRSRKSSLLPVIETGEKKKKRSIICQG